MLNRPRTLRGCAALLAPLVLATWSAPPHLPKRRAINLRGRPVQAPFSDGILVGDTQRLAGRMGIHPKAGKPPDGVEREVHLLLDGRKDAWAHAGMRMDNLVYVQVFCPDLSFHDRFNGIYRMYSTKEFPARAFVGSGLLLRGGHFEPQTIAVKR